MKRKPLGHMQCPIARSLERVGDWWNILILRDAFYGIRRFDEFQESLGIATSTLSRRLDDLVASGLLERRLYCEKPPRHEYVLTEAGRDFRPVMLAMLGWGNRHFAPEGPSIALADAETGMPVDLVLTDRTTGRGIEKVRVVAGSAADAAIRQRLGAIAAQGDFAATGALTMEPSMSPDPRFGVLEPAALAAMPGLDFLRGLIDGSMLAPPFAEVADVAPISAEKGKVVFKGVPSRRFYNPMGTVHGGWISLLLDTVMGSAVHSAIPAGHAYTTIEMKTVYVRPLREEQGPVTCEGVLLHRGTQIASAEGKLYDAKGRLIAYGSETCFVRSLAESARP